MKCALIFFSLILSHSAAAQLVNRPLARYTPQYDYLKYPYTKSYHLDLALIAMWHQTHFWVQSQTWSLEDLMPQNLHHGGQRSIASQVVQHNTHTLLYNSQFKTTAVGAAAYALDKGVQTRLQTSGGRSHQIKLNMQPEQTKAAIRYRGFTDAIVSYQIYNQAFRAELSREVYFHTHVVIDHLESPEEKLDRLSLRWVW